MVSYDSGIGGKRPYYSYARVLCPQWGPRPYLCWVGGGNALAFGLIRLEDGRCGAIYEGCQWAPVAIAQAREESGLQWLPAAGTENYDREPFHVESRRSPLVRVFKRLAAHDRQLRCGMAAENVVRGHAHRNDSAYGASNAQSIVGMAAHLAPRCDGLPRPAWGYVPGTTERADRCHIGRQRVFDALCSSLAFHQRTGRSDMNTISLQALLEASGWNRYADVLDDLVAAERDVVCAEYGAATAQLTLI
jgi:hypothetical protein